MIHKYSLSINECFIERILAFVSLIPKNVRAKTLGQICEENPHYLESEIKIKIWSNLLIRKSSNGQNKTHINLMEHGFD